MTKSKSKIEYIILCCMLLTFLACSFLFVFLKNNIFPIINGIILTSHCFIFGGRYKIYAFAVYSNFTMAMTIINTSVGSFLTWGVIVFMLKVLYERIKAKQKISTNERKILIIFLTLSVCILFTNLFRFQIPVLIRTVSVISYLSIPVFAYLDIRSYKNFSSLLFACCIGFLIANAFSFSFIYVLKDHALDFLQIYIPKYYEIYIRNNISDFRFPGLTGDSNHNGYFALLLSSIILISLKRFTKRNRIIFLVFFIAMQFFAFLGGSKTYIITFALMALIFFLIKFRKNENKLIYLAICTLFVFAIFIVSSYIPSLSKVIIRFLNIDTRIGFLDALTTNRVSIWDTYLGHVLTEPLNMIIGHGVRADGLYGHDYHSLFLQSLWELGILGSFILVLYYKNFLWKKKMSLEAYIPLICILLYGLSLHILYDESAFWIIFCISLYLYDTKEVVEEEKQDKSIIFKGNYDQIEV